ncbi:hypothetical protein IAT38_002901 [Cryptococcus sp. DSM 104549]
MSWFSGQSSSASGVQNFFPATSYHTGFGELTSSDTAWANTSNSGFQTETQTWYTVLADGSMLMVQIIWSYLGIMFIPATTQMTFKLYNPNTKKQVWKSVHGSNPKYAGQTIKADEFEIKHTGTPTTEETYTITASLDKNVQISVAFKKPAEAPGFKLGQGADGGYSTFGAESAKGKRAGHVVHRFHPFNYSTGSVIVDGTVVDAKGDGMFVHAIQGMKPDSVASRWNFAFFTTAGGEEGKLGSVRAIQMEFETTDDYGPKGAKSGRTKVNLGGIYTSSTTPSPLVITGQTHPSSAYPVISKDISACEHLTPSNDKATGYDVPAGIEFKWEGERVDGKGRIGARLGVDKLGLVVGEGGLIEKVDVLAEIPYVIRKGLAAVTGTKPYIYQYHNPATLEVTTGEETVPVKGWLYTEASFVSV